MVAHSFYGFFSIWEKICKNIWSKFFAIISFALLPSKWFNVHVFCRFFCQTTLIEMPSLFQKEKVTCDNCGTQTTINNIVRHKKSCSSGTLYCIHCPNFSTKIHSDLDYHIAKKHSAPKLDVTFRCKLCYQEFPGFHALRQHRNTQHGMQIGTGTREVDVEHIVGDVKDHKLREELRSCQHFLVDSELERARHKVFNYAQENLNAEICDKKFDNSFKKLKSNDSESGFSFNSEKIEDRGFRYS